MRFLNFNQIAFGTLEIESDILKYPTIYECACTTPYILRTKFFSVQYLAKSF